MAVDLRRELSGVAVAIGAVTALGLWLGGVGFLNGDAAAYAVQAAEGDLSQRTVHLGYLALGAQLAEHVPDLPLALDRVSVGAALVAVVAAAWACRDGTGRPAVAALGAAAVLLPIAPFAEVDPLWIALVVAARVLPTSVAWLCFALAVTVSPVALLAAPWAGWGSRERLGGMVLGAAFAVAGLTVVSSGDWWVGDRGVLQAPGPRPMRVIRDWATLLPWALLPLALIAEQGDEAEVLTWVPLVLAPPDVPVWTIPALTLVLRAARGAMLAPDGISEVLLAIQLGIGGFAAVDLSGRIAEEDQIARELAIEIGPTEGLVAPFTWGARVSVRATGTPYGLRWRPPEGFLRQQREAWCTDPPTRVAVLPPVDGEIEWRAGSSALSGCDTPAP